MSRLRGAFTCNVIDVMCRDCLVVPPGRLAQRLGPTVRVGGFS